MTQVGAGLPFEFGLSCSESGDCVAVACMLHGLVSSRRCLFAQVLQPRQPLLELEFSSALRAESLRNFLLGHSQTLPGAFHESLTRNPIGHQSEAQLPDPELASMPQSNPALRGSPRRGSRSASPTFRCVLVWLQHGRRGFCSPAPCGFRLPEGVHDFPHLANGDGSEC